MSEIIWETIDKTTIELNGTDFMALLFVLSVTDLLKHSAIHARLHKEFNESLTKRDALKFTDREKDEQIKAIQEEDEARETFDNGQFGLGA